MNFNDSGPLLQVDNLQTFFNTPRGVARAVDGVSFVVERGKTLAIVGESGCGKSMTALSILQLVPEPAGFINNGQVVFRGADLLDMTWEEMRRVRGKEISMIFQEPMTSLNPTFTIGWQMLEALKIHGRDGQDANRRCEELLGQVELPNTAQIMRQYPHELSGGMRQRVMIAMALANDPKLLIADEPTTALDVTVQAQILSLIRRLQKETGMAVLLITHDLGIVAEMAEDVAVMYAGQIVEYSPTSALFKEPKHPYTQGLFASLPVRARRGQDLAVLEGTVPEATAWPPACRFEPRCRYRWETCARVKPKYRPAEAEHPVRCHLYDPETDRPQSGTPVAAAPSGKQLEAAEPQGGKL